jgi:non-heme chloroperoxidase
LRRSQAKTEEGANQLERRNLLKSIASLIGPGLIDGVAARGSAKKANATVLKGSSTIVASDGTNLFYRDWGSGKPVVFVHSWGLSSDMWCYQMAPMSQKGLRCLSYDRRGHGRSSDPGRGYDYDTLASDLAALLDSLNVQGVTLVSHSMGAGEVLRYLTRYGRNRVARIALVSPTGTPYRQKSPDNPDGIDASVYEGFIRNSLLKDFPKWMEDNARPFVLKETSASTIEWIKGMLLRTSMQALVECQRSGTSTDFRKELAHISVPTLVIQGDKDASAPMELTGRKTAALIPGAQLKIYEGAPHGLFVTHVDRLNSDLLEFIGA